MKRMRIVERARKSLVGRAICRLLGEERGAVMMEYVIVAVLIAAAAVAAVSYFGKDIVAMFNVAGDAASGNSSGASKAREAARDKAGKQANAAVTANGKFSDVEAVQDSGSGGTGK